MPKAGSKPTKKVAKASGKNTKSKVIAKSAKSTNAPPSPMRKSSKKAASPKWNAPYEKKIRMFKTQGDYFQLNKKYAEM